MIAPLNMGLQNDVKPFLIPDDAFAQLNNAYVFRGRVRKRFGSVLMNGNTAIATGQLTSRLRVQVGTIGAPVSPVPGSEFNVGQMFSASDQIFTVWQTGNPAAMLATGVGTGTFSTTTGAFALAGTGLPGATPIYWYPATPVMGLLTYETGALNNEPTIAFDTQFAYRFVSSWERITGEVTPGSSVWTGTDSQFFWGASYRGAANSDHLFFVTNFNSADSFRFYDGTNWDILTPVFNAAGDTILTARIIIPFKDRLLFLNTIEDIGGTPTTFGNRCRFSWNGNPLDATAWREDIPGTGDYLDNVETNEQIISAGFIKDRLIVAFERSFWELVYTGNDSIPFRWQQLNSELGVESTFSMIQFDKALLGVGNVGVMSCNGSNVERIDEKIPSEVFDIHNKSEGVYRVYGIRDYFLELAYWTFPSTEKSGNDTSLKFPNRVLVYNYRNGSWAFNDDSFTCFGYFQRQSDETWSSTPATWLQSLQPWSSATLQAQFRDILAGNQQGFISILREDSGRNAASLQISEMVFLLTSGSLTIINHNLNVGDFIIIENASGISGLNNNIYKVEIVTDANQVTIFANTTPVGSYTGGGTAARVSRVDILTKQYNFYMSQGRNVSVNKVDFCVDRTSNGQITIDYFTSASNESQLNAGAATNSLTSNGILETTPYSIYPYEQTQERLWHPVYIQADGECIQLRIFLSDDQMTNSSIAWSDFELNAMTFYAQPTANRMQ